MKTVDVFEQSKLNHIIEQLHKYEYYETEGKSYEELRRKLATLRAMEIDITSDANRFF